MATTIDLDGANTYFGVSHHLMHGTWDTFTEGQKQAGITHAQRVLERHTGVSDLTGEITSASDNYRPDYATYEQALHMLLTMPHSANGEATGPKFHSVMLDGGEPTQNGKETIAKEAARWLLVRQGATVKVDRG